MTLRSISLRKLLKIMYLQGQPLVSELRKDIRNDIQRERGEAGGGGDFYGPFWKDAKDHAFGDTDLHDTTARRIVANPRRTALYERLRDGFLLWWNERRRWTNAPFEPISVPTTRHPVIGLDTTVKVDCIFAVRDGRGDRHYVYPYWFPDPIVHEEAGRLALWLLTQAMPQIAEDEFRILDVIRGQTFSLERNPLRGDESAIFARRYEEASAEWQRLRDTYR